MSRNETRNESNGSAAAAAEALRRVRALLASVRWSVLLVVPALAAGLAWAISAGLYQPRKATLETLSLWATGAATAGCLLRWAASRDPWFGWAAALTANLAFREVHVEWASDFVYLGLAILAGVALRHYALFRDRLGQPALVTGLATGFTMYAVAVAVDQRWARGLPYEEVWQMLLEETLELVGHVVIGVTLVVSPRRHADDGEQGRA
jgi:hypothetical protein